MTNETYPDPVVGILAVGALLAALRRRRQTGKGTFVDLAQREVTASMLGEYVVDYALSGRVASPMGNRHPWRVPQGVYRCQGEDRWLAISVGSDAEWQGLCQALGQPQLTRDARFATALARQQHQDELDQLLSAWTQERSHYEAMHLLQAHGVTAGAVLTGGDTLSDPHLEAREFWDVVDHPEAGTYKQVTTPWRLSKNPRRTTAAAPSLGEHNHYVLADILGLSAQEIAVLEAQGIIGTHPTGARMLLYDDWITDCLNTLTEKSSCHVDPKSRPTFLSCCQACSCSRVIIGYSCPIFLPPMAISGMITVSSCHSCWMATTGISITGR
jgi:crotonobetainyl-CoA:carnitine CoA-transferase CaiB-like acyl-CoA transferase